MARMPKPDDLGVNALRPSLSASQINIGVAAKTGQAGRAMGAAIADLGGAFGQIAGRLQEAGNAQNDARFQIEWNKAQTDTWNDINQTTPEDGSGWQQFTPRLEAKYKELDEKYPVSGQKRRLRRELGATNDILRRGQRAALTMQDMGRKHALGVEQKEVGGIVQQLNDDPSDENYERLKTSALDLIESGRGTYYTESDIQRRRREVLSTLALTRANKLLEDDPETAKKLFDEARKLKRAVPIEEDQGSGADSSSVKKYLNKNALRGWDKVNPKMQKRIALMLSDMPEPLRQGLLISDTARSWDQQVAAARRHGVDPIKGKPGTLAPWGRGRHHGDDVQAVDFYKPAPRTLAWMRENAPKYGLKFPEWGRKNDPWHMEMDRNFKDREGEAPSASDGVSQIVAFEARRDKQGRITVYEPPSNDDGGKFEVAGINERHHPKAAAKLARMVKAGNHDEAERYAEEYIRKYTDKSAALVPGDAAQFVVRDMAFNRGPGGANAALRMAVGATPRSKAAAHKALTADERARVERAAQEDPSGFIQAFTQARADYESQFVGKRENLAVGLKNRWAKAERIALEMANGGQGASSETLPGGAGEDEDVSAGRAGLTALFGDQAEPILRAVEDEPNAPLSQYLDKSELKELSKRIGADASQMTVKDAMTAAYAISKADGGPESVMTERERELMALAKQNPETKLTDVLSDEERAEYTQRFGSLRGVTVGQAAERIGAASEEIEGRANGVVSRAAIAEEFPMGRVNEGQAVTVESQRLGRMTWTAEELNAISPKQLRSLAKSADRRFRSFQRQQRSIAKGIMSRQLRSVEDTGASVNDYDPDLIGRVMAGTPEAKAFNWNLEIAKLAFRTKREMADFDREDLEERYADLREAVERDAGYNPTARAILGRTESAINKLLRQRERDPAQAVQQSREVQAVRKEFKIGREGVKDAKQAFAMVDARMKAQERLGLKVVPLTKDEADSILGRINQVPANKRREATKQVWAKVQQIYGRHAEMVMRAAVDLSRIDKEDDRTRLDREMRRSQRRATPTITDESVINRAIKGGREDVEEEDVKPNIPFLMNPLGLLN